MEGGVHRLGHRGRADAHRRGPLGAEHRRHREGDAEGGEGGDRAEEDGAAQGQHDEGGPPGRAIEPPAEHRPHREGGHRPGRVHCRGGEHGAGAGVAEDQESGEADEVPRLRDRLDG